MNHGTAAAEALLKKDPGSYRINPEAMKIGEDKIKAALIKLSKELGVPVLQKGNYTASKEAAVKARGFAKTAEDFAQLITDLKITKYLRS